MAQMRRRRPAIVLFVLLAAHGLPARAAGVEAPRAARLRDVVVAQGLTEDLLHPEGKSRWELSSMSLGAARIVAATHQDDVWTVTEEAGDGEAIVEDGASAGTVRKTGRSYLDPTGGDAVSRWLFPERYEEFRRPGERQVFDLEEVSPSGLDRLRIEMATVGVGWLQLPSGPRETFLQRILVLRKGATSAAFVPEAVIHRWVDPFAGVVAEVSGPASDDGRYRMSVERASVLETLLTPAAALKLHLGELDASFGDITYGWDRGPGTTIASLTPNGFTTIGDLIAASSWNFSGNTTGSELVSYSVPNSAADTCNSGTATCNGGSNAGMFCDGIEDCPGGSCPIGVCQGGSNPGANCDQPSDCTGGGTCRPKGCGYAKLPAGGGFQAGQLDRRDTNPTGTLVRSNSVSQTEVQANKAVIWLRGGSQKEGVAGAFGTGESRFCYVPFDSNLDGTLDHRSQVPEWVMPRNDNDGQGFYLQAGDSWGLRATCAGGSNAGGVCVGPLDCPGGSCGQCVGGSNPGVACSSFETCTGGGVCNATFGCEQIAFNQVCGAPGLFDRLWGKGCIGSNGSPHHGKQTGEVIKNGVITLPSGHTFNALLARVLTDFCVYSGSTCGTKLDEVRTTNYIWQVPRLGTLVRIQSAQNAVDTTSWTTAQETSFTFGLFPPRAIQVTGTTNTTVSLSWDPGIDTHRISGYKIYWDTDPGASTPYAFNSVTHAGQVSFAGTTATISGLSSGTPYYFTVTSLSTYTRTRISPNPPVATTYESIVYPTQVYGDPSFVYPVEVQGVTTGGSCTPTAQVNGLTVTKAGSNVQICWSPASDPCLIGYRVLRSSSATSDAGFSTLADVGLTTCWMGAANPGYFLVVARGTGGTGPWGHYGH